MKKNKSLLLISSVLLGGLITPSNVVVSEKCEEVIAYESVVANSTSLKLDNKKLVIGEGEVDKSSTYVQYGKNTVSGNDVLRFATAVKGELSSLKYYYTYGETTKEVEITTLYKGLNVEGNTTYYTPSGLTTASSAEGQYYWACFTLEFKSEKEINTEFSSYLLINEEIQNETALTTLGKVKYAHNTTLSPEVPTEWVDVNYKVNLGSWDVSKDANGVATLKNTSNKSMLMFEEELFAEGGNIAFDLTTDNLSGFSAQGLVFGAYNANAYWTSSTDKYYVVGRNTSGKPYATGISGAAINNIDLGSVVNNINVTDTTKTYRYNLVVNGDTTVVYIDGALAGIARFKYDFTGGYIGISSGVKGTISLSNIQVNGKGLNVKLPEELSQSTTGYKVNSGEATVTDNKIATTANKTTVMLTDVKVGDGSVIEFDLKSSTSYQVAYPQSIILGAANPDIIYTTSTDFYYAVGRMKNGKMGGYYVNGGSFNFGTEATDGTAVQVMQDVAKTYRIKVEIDYSVEGEETFVTYVDGVFARSFTFNYGFRGEYIGFTSAASGELEISNIVVDNVAYTLSN